MVEGAKRDWIRIGLDILIPITFGLLAWAGAVLWGISTAQIELHASQKTLTATVVSIQTTQGDLDDRLRSQENWKAETSANRFTVQHGHELWQEVARIKEHIASLRFGEPPDWFQERVERLAERVEDLEHKADAE